MDAFRLKQNNNHRARRCTRQPDRPSDRHHWSYLATVETDHLAEPGISFRLGHRGFRHVSLRAILQSGDRVQYATPTGMGNHRSAERRGLAIVSWVITPFSSAAHWSQGLGPDRQYCVPTPPGSLTAA